MTSSQLWFCAFLGALAVERMFEVWLSRKNAEWAVSQGAVEVGERHFRVMSLMHTAFFAACAAEVLLLGRAFPGAVGYVALAAAVGSQGLRYWAISTLGRRWNVRIIILPSQPPVVGGPYRFIRHPNYVAVCVELLAVPLIHGAWATAAIFTALNAAMLYVRIRAEENALGARYEEAFARTPRFVPLGGRDE